MKKMNFIPKDKKNLKFILYLFSFFIFISITYISIPKLLIFSLESIQKNLKINNNINIDNISKVDYKIFPTPRLIISNSNFTIGKNIIEVKNCELEIILKLSQILNFKDVNYKKLLINEGISKIKFNDVSLLLAIVGKNKKKLTFKKNNIIFLQNEKVFFKINDAVIKVGNSEKKLFLDINGYFLNNKVLIKLDNSSKNKKYFTLKLPELDTAAKVFFGRNSANNLSGSLNLEIFNNFLKLKFIKKDNIKLTDGFIRSKLINTSLKGEVVFTPNFYARLDFKPSSINIKKLFLFVQKTYFSDNINNLNLIKKINGIYNFKSKFEGRVINNNGEVIFENFRVGKNKSYYLDARVIEFGKKGRIQFTLVKTFKYEKDLLKKVEISGFVIPFSSKVIFQKFLIDGGNLSVDKIKEHENKFEDDLVQNYLGNIFNERKMNKYFKDIF
tara:strand:- start:2492 stop:3820 length:1329 start_codon:yes stop_codon:yes gene_type:complete